VCVTPTQPHVLFVLGHILSHQVKKRFCCCWKDSDEGEKKARSIAGVCMDAGVGGKMMAQSAVLVLYVEAWRIR